MLTFANRIYRGGCIKMSKEEVIKQLTDLKLDRQSFLEDDADHDEIYLKDIQAIDYAISVLKIVSVGVDKSE